MGFNHENLRNHGDYMGVIRRMPISCGNLTVCPDKPPFFLTQ